MCEIVDKKYPCACCGFLTMHEPNAGTFEICPTCYWEDDHVQFDDAFFKGGANEECLSQARINFLDFGASSSKYIAFVRKPDENENNGES